MLQYAWFYFKLILTEICCAKFSDEENLPDLLELLITMIIIFSQFLPR